MSRFDMTFTIEAAALAYAVRPRQADADARATAPLLGKEEALLAALRRGRGGA